jgi:Uma2 family endonuclease
MDDLAVRNRQVAQTRLTFAAFSAFYDTRPSHERWELIDGDAIMMSPPTWMHQRSRRNIETMINHRLSLSQFLSQSQSAWEADSAIGVHVAEDQSWAPEPDITVADKNIPPGLIYAERFYFIVEVLSSDRPDVLAKKRAYHRAHEHNRGFMFMSQKSVSVELVRRTANGWITDTLTNPEAAIDLPDIGVIGTLRQFYRATELEPK